MATTLFIGQLSFNTTESELENLFANHGAVTSVKIIQDRDTGRSKGFGFVEMSDQTEAQATVKALHGQTVDGRALVVNVARPKEDTASHPRGGDNRANYRKRY